MVVAIDNKDELQVSFEQARRNYHIRELEKEYSIALKSKEYSKEELKEKKTLVDYIKDIMWYVPDCIKFTKAIFKI